MGAEETDPMQEVADAMATTIGSQELALRMKLGNDDYVAWKTRSDSIENAAVSGAIWDAAFKRHNADLVQQQCRYVTSKAQFWSSFAVAIVIMAVLIPSALLCWVLGA